MTERLPYFFDFFHIATLAGCISKENFRISNYKFMNIENGNIGKEETEAILQEQALKNFETLHDDIKSDMEILRENASENVVTKYLEREVQLGRQQRLEALNDFLNINGE